MSFKCLCGCNVKINNITKHLEDKKHDVKVMKKYGQSTNDLLILMQRLDDVKDKMNEGDYLQKCNKLKITYEYWSNEVNFERKWTHYLLQKKVYLSYTDNQNKIHWFNFDIK